MFTTKTKEQKLVEEADKSSNINIVKIDKNKFVSIIKPVIIEEKNEKPITKIINKNYDLNDYDYDFEYSDFEDKRP